MTEDVTFGRWLRQRRRRRDLTQESLATRVGYALAAVRRVEADDLRPSRELAEKLADALGLATDERPAFVRFARGERDAYLPLPAAPATPVPAPTSLPRHNLPAQPTPLIGRETEIQAVCNRLSRPDVRLLT
ncbi:MAG: helix-turn-helix transcriptional regulator, partial [Anaerolineae bacterium]|nr:helix-turn-helix transcriptional regulator [Anaerolineae bacterium]